MSRRNVSLWFGGGFIALLLILSLSAPLWYPNDPYYFETVNIEKMDNAPYPPSAEMPLGSDGVGRDLLSRLLTGFQWTFALILLITLGKYVLAIPFGCLAGVKGKWLAKLTETWSLYVSGFPALLVMIIVFKASLPIPWTSGFWPRIIFMVAVVALLEWARIGMSIKGQVEQVMKSPYIDAARVMGRSQLGVILHHVWPVLRAETISQFMFECSRSLMVIGQLAIFGIYFLGTQMIEINTGVSRELGLHPEWGSMLGESRDYMLIEPVIPFFIAGLIVLTILAFNLLGDGLRNDLNIPASVKKQTEWKWGPLSLNGRKLAVGVSCIAVIVLTGWKYTNLSLHKVPVPDEVNAAPTFNYTVDAEPKPKKEEALAGTEEGAKLVKETAKQFEQIGLKPLNGEDILSELKVPGVEKSEQTYQIVTAKIDGKDDTLDPVTFFATLEEKDNDTVVRNMQRVAERLAEEKLSRPVHFVLLEGGLSEYLQRDSSFADREILIRMLPYTYWPAPESIGNQYVDAQFTRVSGYQKRSNIEEAFTQAAWRNGHIPTIHRGTLFGSFVAETLDEKRIPVLTLSQDTDAVTDIAVDFVKFLGDQPIK